MAPQRPSQRGSLLQSLRSGTTSLRTALSQLATRKKDLQAAPTPFIPKPTPEGPRWGPLVLLDKVGEGAFGEVYRAWDVTLEREVALKLMRAADEDPAALREARMLARLRHPNVVTVYGADRHDGRSGVWMDFIEGETIADIVERRGSFAPSEALLAGIDICRALATVHQSGLLHRDIKAQNVMREHGGRIVLMDFGLGHEAAVAASDFGGTPLYMAPELLEGEPATVRGDIYSVGVLLFHMVTGTYPAQGSTLDELRAVHASHGYQTLRDLRSQLPSPFVRAVEKAIAPEPSRRYATAGQMTEALEAALGQRRSLLTRRAFWVTATPLAAAGAGVAWYWNYRPSAAVTAGASLFLTEISNATGDRQLDSVTEVLRNQLAQSAHFNLLEADRVRETLRMMTRPPEEKPDVPVARELALRTQTPLLVYGTLSPLGTGYGLGMVIERIEGQPRTPKTSESKLFEARNKNGLFDAMHQAATWIRQTAGEASKDISASDTQPEEATTSSWEALDYYTKAERLKAQNQGDKAMSLYKEAVRADPGFALALVRLAGEQGIHRLTTESFTSYRRAVDALDRRRVTRREDLRIRGLYAIQTEDYATAEELIHTLTLLYPNDSSARHNRALALRNLGRLEEARKELLEAHRLRPGEPHLTNLTVVALMLGRASEAESYVRQLKPETAGNYQGRLRFLQRDFAGAEAAFAAASKIGEPRLRSLALGARAALLAELGRVREAAQVLEEGIKNDADSGNNVGQARKRVALGYLRLAAGNRDGARTEALAASLQDPDTGSRFRAGSLLARAGFTADARTIRARMSGLYEGRRFEAATQTLDAEIALAEGRAADALAGFETADRLTAPIRPRQFLARVWERAGRLDEARTAFLRIAAKPELVWSEPPDLYDPGIWSESLLRAAELSIRLGAREEGRAALQQFLKLREHADPDSPQSSSARRLLSVDRQ